jgi:tyrosine-protein kinase Etk/Wzc
MELIMDNKDEKNFIDLVFLFYKRKKLIIINALIFSIISTIIAFVLPKWYRADAIIMPPEKEGLSFGISGAGDIAGLLMGGSGFDLPMFATASDVYFMILKSDGVAINIIKKYKLEKEYKSKYIEEAIEYFNQYSDIEVGKEGAIFIKFQAKENPGLAVNVINAYIDELDKANKRIRFSRASDVREFIEKRLENTKISLKIAEEDLRKYQELHGTVSLPDQITASINNIALLYAQKMSVQIQIDAINNNVGKANSQIDLLKQQLSAIDKSLNEMARGNTDKNQQTLLFPPISKTPLLGMEIMRLMRDLKIQEVLFELLTQQYEQALINEKRDTPTVQVLDKPTTPTKKYRPKRMIIVILSFFVSIMFSMIIIFAEEYFEKLKINSPDKFKNYKTIVSSMNLKKYLRRY